jgi:hypothetical protein
MITVNDANTYIETHVIDIEDWQEADDVKKQRILKSAEITLQRKFKNYTIPDSAIYHFAAWLAIVFNDTNRFQQHGIAGYAITGVASFTFKENNVTSKGSPMASLIPDEVYELVGEANGVNLKRRRVGRSVR